MAIKENAALNEPAKFVTEVTLIGPIAWWWEKDESGNRRYGSPAHVHFDQWRDAISDALWEAGRFLVYHPHKAFRGRWTNHAQPVNDTALDLQGVVIDMSPPGTASKGTTAERHYASLNGSQIIEAPPPEHVEEFGSALAALIEKIDALGAQREIVDQRWAIEAIGYRPGREWMIKGLLERYRNHPVHVYHRGRNGELVIYDGVRAEYLQERSEVRCHTNSGCYLIPIDRLVKIEVFDQEPVTANATT
jgi:hypothetical protein